MGGGFAMSRGIQAPTQTTPAPDVIQGGPKEDKYNFWDDLGAWFTEPVNDNIFKTPIGGAAQRREDEADKWNQVMGEGNLTEDGRPKVPTNEQLKQLGRTDQVSIDGDLIPLNGSPDWNTTLRQQGKESDKKIEQADFNSQLRRPGVLGTLGQPKVRQLTQQEWDAMTPDQQQGVLATYALFKAGIDDRALGDDEVPTDEYKTSVDEIFGKNLGSDEYMPNTVQVLKDLGYQNEKLDLDSIRNGSAFASYNDIMGTGNIDPNAGRMEVFQSLVDSSSFDMQSIQKSLEGGARLLDALRNTQQSLGDSFVRYSGLLGPGANLTEEDQSYLTDLVTGMGSRSVWERLHSEKDLNERMASDLAIAKEKYGDDVVANFFTNTVRSWDNHTDFMNLDEFNTNWMGG
jgi:hypothetical protein